MEHTHVFIGGLHRSGTSLLTRCLAAASRWSADSPSTGAIEDEGQHLQTVYHPANRHGGPGRFGFHDQAYLDEASPLVTEENRQKLLAEWSPHWDMSRAGAAREVAAQPDPYPVPAGALPGGPAGDHDAPSDRGRLRHPEVELDVVHLADRALARVPRAAGAGCAACCPAPAGSSATRSSWPTPIAQLAEVLRFLGLEPHASGLTVRDSHHQRGVLRALVARTAGTRSSATTPIGPSSGSRSGSNRFGYSMREPGQAGRAAGCLVTGCRGALMARERGAANDNYRNLPAPIAQAGKEVMLLPRRITGIAPAAAGLPDHRRASAAGRRPCTAI